MKEQDIIQPTKQIEISKDANFNVATLISMGCHLGHKKVDNSMLPYIVKRTPQGTLIDVEKTVRIVSEICHFLQEKIKDGYQIVFVCSHPSAAINQLMMEFYKNRPGSSIFLKTWGGILTNFVTVLHSRQKLVRLINNEAILRKNIEDHKNSPIFVKVTDEKLKENEKERLKKYSDYEGMGNLQRVTKTIFMAPSLDPLTKTFVKEIEEINKNEEPKNWSYLIAIADVNVNISNMIGLGEYSDLTTNNRKRIFPIPANINKISVISTIIKELLSAIDSVVPAPQAATNSIDHSHK